MMGAAREKTQADFDLERFIQMFDDALTSDDPRVKNALQSLMMMTILTASNTPNQRIGPLRQLYDDVNHITRRLSRIENDVIDRQIRPQVAMAEQAGKQWPDVQAKYTMTAAEAMAKDIDLKLAASVSNKINGGLLHK